MLVRRWGWIRSCLLALLLTTFSFAASWGIVIDPNGNGPERSFLLSVQEAFDRVELDVVLGPASQLSVGQRERVASLKDYTPVKSNWGNFIQQSWEYGFGNGIVGVIVAVPRTSAPPNLQQKVEACRPPKPEEIQTCEFVEGWVSALPEQRVFIAFTREDFDAAQRAKKALEEAGYHVFVFLRGKHDEPWAEPAFVGEVFATAGHRLVIDTVSARGSEGVRFESLCCEPLLMGPAPRSKWSEAIKQARL